MTIKTERITVRVPENVHALLARASTILGSTMNQFLVQAAIERAKQVVEEENIIRLSGKSTELFLLFSHWQPAKWLGMICHYLWPRDIQPEH